MPTYRPFFDLSYDYLEAIVDAGVWELLKSPAQTTFAPYSIDGSPHPISFDVLPPKEIPDTADLLLSRYPFGLSLEGTRTWPKPEIPTSAVSGSQGCGETTTAGGDGETTTQHALGDAAGLVVIDFEMFTQPDRLDVYFAGALVATTGGLVSGAGSVEFYYRARRAEPNACVVTVTGGGAGTGWEYTLRCPDTSVLDPNGDCPPPPESDPPLATPAGMRVYSDVPEEPTEPPQPPEASPAGMQVLT